MKNLLLLSIVSISMLFASCGDDEINGCTDPNSDNYDPLANTDDGSCFISGCSDPNASNYNPDATVEGNCLYPGCTDVQSDQYDETANDDDGSCQTYFDRWTASFNGDFSCTGILQQFLGDATMTFTKRDIPNNVDSMDVMLEFSLSETPLNFSASITRDSMYATAEFMEIDIDTSLLTGFPITIEKISLDIDGVLGISADNTTVQGILNFDGTDLTSGFNTPIQSSCEFTGERQ